MIDWLSDNAWVGWIGAAVLLASVEIMTLDLVLLMFALGALAGAVPAGLGAPIWVSVLVFAGVSLALLFLVRPALVARLHAGPTLQQGHDALVGRVAVVTEPVSDRGGRVHLASETWSARSDREGSTFPTDAEVVVTRIDGATAVVRAKES